ncbi:hypothetical protein MATL_G00035490 [Megalops atlanticus]|uniref:Uncharacterized protein n=1 Tax=Megalops atlanticus TaxID=7932 RepID=A0A9D3TIP3_MEGAT|nr:hypothetical protein MATL_G00035490 [Megalops atlanticus]
MPWGPEVPSPRQAAFPGLAAAVPQRHLRERGGRGGPGGASARPRRGTAPPLSADVKPQGMGTYASSLAIVSVELLLSSPPTVHQDG